MRRTWLTVGAGACVALGAIAVWATTYRNSASIDSLVYVQDVPADVRSETEDTWLRFTDRFAARTSCWSQVSLELVRDVAEGDARYVADSNRIEIEIPTTPARYRESLAHELAHHIERTCPEFETLRVALEPMLGTDQQGWASGSVWAEVPSERFAEAVVLLVNGERVRHETEVVVEPGVVEVIEHWGLGESLPQFPEIEATGRPIRSI